MKIILATNNTHKLKEFSSAFNAEVFCPKDISLTSFNPDESADSFSQNAMIKAKSLYEALKQRGIEREYIILADDSGLCVDALNGKPGVLSARWSNVVNNISSNENSSDSQNRDALATALKNLGISSSRGYFECSIAFIMQIDSSLYDKACREYNVLESISLGDKHIIFGVVSGITEGIVSCKQSGENGFGYDSMFYIGNKPIATLTMQEKLKISHRGKAILEIQKLLKIL